MREIEIKATSVEQAILEGLAELGATRDQVDVEVISEPKLFKKACVKLTLRESAKTTAADNEITADAASDNELTPVAEAESDSADENKGEVSSKTTAANNTEIIGDYDDNDAHTIEFLRSLIESMGLSCTLKVTSTRDTLSILIGGKDSNYVIGYRGETLDAVQYIALLVANKPNRFSKRLVIDAEGYREKRAETLTALSKKLASQAVKSGKAIELEPMNPFERRVIHTALQENPAVTTISEGDEPNRFVVICPVKPEPSYDNENKSNFKKQGFGKTRSFGQKKRRF